jgi:hypothetical protein
MEAATGERIVAFGRAGKPLEKTFFRPFCTSIEARRITGYAALQRILKPHRVRL